MSMFRGAGDELGEDPGLPREEHAAVLERRARALAVPPASGRGADLLDLIVFQLGAESYAAESRFVLEIFRSAEVALIPGGAPPVFGVTAWRGELLPLLDLRALLGLAPAAGEGSRIVAVLGEARPAFGVTLDSMPHLQEVPASAVQPLPADAAGEGGYLRGATADALLVLDTVKLIRTHS